MVTVNRLVTDDPSFSEDLCKFVGENSVIIYESREWCIVKEYQKRNYFCYMVVSPDRMIPHSVTALDIYEPKVIDSLIEYINIKNLIAVL